MPSGDGDDHDHSRDNQLNPRHSVAGQNETWQDPLENLAERLDYFQSNGSGSDSEQQLAWSLFAECSPYSPVRLDSELGWRPIPKDLPSHCDPSYFGWTDAFEDLLAVSSAHPMMSLERRQLMNQVLAASPLATNPFWYLYSRLAWQKLDEAYFPLYIPGKRYRSPRRMEEWVTLRKAQLGTVPSDDWMKAIEMLEKDMARGMAVVAPFLSSTFFHDARETTPLSLHQWLNAFFNGGDADASGPRTEEDMYLRDNSQKDPNPANGIGTLARILKKVLAGDDEQHQRPQQQQQQQQQPDPEGDEEEVHLKGPIIEQTKRETENGGYEIVKKRVRQVPGFGEVRTTEVERKDERGRTISIEIHTHSHTHTADTSGEWIPSYWKKIWDSGQASSAAGEKKSTDEESK